MDQKSLLEVYNSDNLRTDLFDNKYWSVGIRRIKYRVFVRSNVESLTLEHQSYFFRHLTTIVGMDKLQKAKHEETMARTKDATVYISLTLETSSLCLITMNTK